MTEPSKPCCGSCLHFEPSDSSKTEGWCYRFPPTLIVQPEIPDEVSQCRPVMQSYSRCGEHQLFQKYVEDMREYCNE